MNELLVDKCLHILEREPKTYNNFYTVILKKPYTIRGKRDDGILILSVNDILADANKYKEYVVTDCKHGDDCSIIIRANLPGKSVIDFINYNHEYLDSKYLKFKEILSGEIYYLDHIKAHEINFANTCVVEEVEVNNVSGQIQLVRFIFNGGTY